MNVDGEPESMGTKPPKVLRNSKYPTQKEVSDVIQERVVTSTVLPATDRTIMFRIEPNSRLCTNLSLLSVRLHVSVKDRAGSAQKENLRKKCFIPGPLPLSMFKEVRISANGTVVTESDNLYPFIGSYLTLTRLSQQTLSLLKETALFYTKDFAAVNALEDSTGKRKVTLTSSEFEDLDKRLSLYSVDQKEPIELNFYLITDLNFDRAPAIFPPNTAIDIELLLQDPSKAIIKMEPDGALDPVISVSLAEILVTRIAPSSRNIPRAIKQEFMKCRATPLIIPSGTTVFRNTLSFSNSPLPSRLYMTFVSNDAFDGDYSQNLYSSAHHNVSSVIFNVSGRKYPISAVSADFTKDLITDMYLRTAESLRFSLQNSGQTLEPLSKYKSGAWKIAVDISPDFSSGASWGTQKERGYIGVEIVFSKPLEERLIGIVISEISACMSINSNGEVSLE